MQGKDYSLFVKSVQVTVSLEFWQLFFFFQSGTKLKLLINEANEFTQNVHFCLLP